MIHRDLLHSIKERRQHGGFIYPDYGEHSIAELSQSILATFGIHTGRPTLPFPLATEVPKRILFLFIDGFGFNHFLTYRDRIPFLDRLAERAQVYPLTSVFPSTTPAALTTLHTGLTPQEHGLPEWTVYFEEFDRIIETLPFRPHLTDTREALLESGGTPDMLYAGTTLYEQLAAQDISSYVLLSEEYAHSAYSQVSQKGARIVPVSGDEHLFSSLTELLTTVTGPAYFFVNWSGVDSAEHIFGPGSQEHEAALRHLSNLFEMHLVPLARTPEANDTLVVLSSDHGQSAIAHEDIIYLNNYLELEESYYRRTPESGGIRPTGAPHDVFLFLDRARVPEIQAYLRRELAGKADVLTIPEALTSGLFGLYEPTERFVRRIGDLLILPYEGYHVWYRHMPDTHFMQKGIHGGLSESEMIVPLATARLSDFA